MFEIAKAKFNSLNINLDDIKIHFLELPTFKENTVINGFHFKQYTPNVENIYVSKNNKVILNYNEKDPVFQEIRKMLLLTKLNFKINKDLFFPKEENIRIVDLPNNNNIVSFSKLLELANAKNMIEDLKEEGNIEEWKKYEYIIFCYSQFYQTDKNLFNKVFESYSENFTKYNLLSFEDYFKWFLNTDNLFSNGVLIQEEKENIINLLKEIYNDDNDYTLEAVEKIINKEMNIHPIYANAIKSFINDNYSLIKDNNYKI